MNKTYLKAKDNIKSINLNIFIALLPLLFTGFYKNGLKLYMNNLVSVYGLFKPLLFDIIGLLCGIIVNIIYNRIKKSNNKIFNDFYPLYGLLIASVISINTNIALFTTSTFILLLISKLLNNNKINIIAFTSLIIIFISNLLGQFTYLNLYEQKNTLTLNSLDYLIGRGSGGINTTYILVLIISLIVLSVNRYYKKEIPLYSSITFISCLTFYLILTNKIGTILDNIFTNGILFSYIFIAPEFLTSSYTKKGKIIYSIIIGVGTFILYLFYPPLSALGGIIIASLCHRVIDKLCQR